MRTPNVFASNVVAVTCAALLVPALLVAQRPQTRQGFWIGFGWGWGSAAQSCDSCTATGRQNGFSGFLKMGGRINDRLLLGGESNGWITRVAGQKVRGSLTFSAYYYPKPAGGTFLRAGLGFSTFENAGSPAFSGVGPGYIIGAGTDIRVGRNVSLTPALNLFGGKPKLTSSGFVPPGNFTQNVVQIVLGITFH